MGEIFCKLGKNENCVVLQISRKNIFFMDGSISVHPQKFMAIRFMKRSLVSLHACAGDCVYEHVCEGGPACVGGGTTLPPG